MYLETYLGFAVNQKDLDALLWDWAASTIKEQDSGFPSSYELSQRVDCGIVFTPDYYPRPKLCRLAGSILCLEKELRNVIIAKYLFCREISEIAKYNACHKATVYRKLTESRKKLLDEMQKFTHN